jgi:hypothetical protein
LGVPCWKRDRSSGVLIEGFDFPQSVQESGSRDSLVGIVTRLRAGRSGARIPEGERGVLFSKTPRPALGPTQPPVQRVPSFFPEIKRPEREVIHSPRFSVEVKNEWPRIRLNGMDGEDLTIQRSSS